MQSLTRAETRAFDRHAIEHLGIPALVLMENAGRGTVDVMQALGVQGPVVLCCGKGNNGGDGLVIARHLANRDIAATALLFARPEELSPDAAAQWRIVQLLRLPAQVWPADALDEAQLAKELAQAAWVVDALFGTGLTGPMRAPFARIAALINAGPARVLAVDIPSGLDADTGLPMGTAVRAAHTVTFVAPKAGFQNPEAAVWLGQVHVVDIGVSLNLTQKNQPLTTGPLTASPGANSH
jgi:NAD(P)H-hydrate epimerase